jgi:hypothetical protein
MESIVQEFANVGFTLFCIVACVILVNWLDRNVFNKTRRQDND